MKKHIVSYILLAVFALEGIMAADFVLDDFAEADGITAIGTEWQGFTDQVMGGRSEMSTSFRAEDGRIFLRMEGDVLLENNGGFIQVKLPLERQGRAFDASEYSGIKIRYRTPEPGGYYLHLRTKRTRLPWAHFAAPLQGSPEWTTELVPWDAFEKQLTLLRRPKLQDLTGVAVVAAKQEFRATIDVAYLGLY